MYISIPQYSIWLLCIPLAINHGWLPYKACVSCITICHSPTPLQGSRTQHFIMRIYHVSWSAGKSLQESNHFLLFIFLCFMVQFTLLHVAAYTYVFRVLLFWFIHIYTVGSCCNITRLISTRSCLQNCNYKCRTYSVSQEICTWFCCALLCCGYAIVHNEFTWSIYPYSSGLLCWHWGNR